MKTVTVTKDAYIGKSVRVNYFDENAKRKEERLREDLSFTDKNEYVYEEVEVTYTELLFCERLEWTNDESELNAQIETKRLELEKN